MSDELPETTNEAPMHEEASNGAGDGGDPSEAFTTATPLQEYWFEEATRAFWIRNAAGEWIFLSEGAFRRHLKKQGLREKPVKGAILSAIDEKIREIEQDRRIAFVGELAGYKQGIQWITGQRVLVPKAPTMIQPVKGEWPTLRAYFDGLLTGYEPGANEGDAPIYIDQRDWFFGWLQHLLQCYYDGIIAPGLALCVAGERDSGKSRLAMILRWCLGDKVSKPYDYMIGRDNFNKEMFSAVLQLVDDENADTRIDMRLKFGAQIKKVVANDEAKQRGMHRDGVNVSVLWRLLILVNLEANRLMVMPPVDSDIKDKVTMLKGYRRPKPDYEITMETPYEQACWPMPMPTRTEAEKRALRDRWQAELPAFIWWLLNEYKMPKHVAGGRFCVRHWQHPQILERLQQFSPHVRIWQIIEQSGVVFKEYVGGGLDGPAEWKPRPEWKGTITQLHELLTSETSKLSMNDKRAVPDPAWLAQRLESCREHFGEAVCTMKRTHKAKIWTLKDTPGLTE